MSLRAYYPKARQQRASTQRRSGLRRTAIGLALGAVLLSGCAAGMISQTAQQVAAIDGANATVGGMSVLNVHFAAPDKPAGAVAYPEKSTAHLVLTISNAGLDSDTLVSVASPVGPIKLAKPVEVPASSSVELAKDTSVAVTLTQPLKHGISVPVTFSFAKAGALTTNVVIAIPDQRDTKRPTVDILPPHPTNLWQRSEH